jgi:hypothetical protein
MVGIMIFLFYIYQFRPESNPVETNEALRNPYAENKEEKETWMQKPLRSTTWWIWKARGKKLEIKDYNTKKQSFKKKYKKHGEKLEIIAEKAGRRREEEMQMLGRRWTTTQRTDKLCACAHVKATSIDRSSRLATTVSFQHNSMHHHQECTKPWSSLLLVYLCRLVCPRLPMDGSMCRSCGTQHSCHASPTRLWNYVYKRVQW